MASLKVLVSNYTRSSSSEQVAKAGMDHTSTTVPYCCCWRCCLKPFKLLDLAETTRKVGEVFGAGKEIKPGPVLRKRSGSQNNKLWRRPLLSVFGILPDSQGTIKFSTQFIVSLLPTWLLTSRRQKTYYSDRRSLRTDGYT